MTRGSAHGVTRLVLPALILIFMGEVARPAFAKPRRSENAVEAQIEGQWVLLLSDEEVEARAQVARALAAELEKKAAATAAARLAAEEEAAGEATAARARSGARRRHRRSGPPLYHQQRIAGRTYRQATGYSCSAASMTIALSLLDKKPANQATEALVMKKLGSNLSKKDGLTGQGMSALADVAKTEFAVSARRIESTDDVTSEVKAGHLVVLDVRRPISGSGHYVVVAGPGQRPGTLHIKDPAPDGGDFEWDSRTLRSAIKAGGVSVWND